MSTTLNDTELVMLSAAAQRNDRCLVAPPNLKDSAARRATDKLIAAGLAKEVKAKAGAPIWRRDEESGHPYALKLTAAGAKAIAVNESDEPGHVHEVDSLEKVDEAAATSQQHGALDLSLAGAIQRASPSPSAPRGGTKLAQVIELLERNDGATIDDLIAATGWLPHTTRAALTGLRKRGYAVAIDRSDKERGSIYRINADLTVEDNAAVVHSEDAQANSATVPKKAQRQAKSNARRAASWRSCRNGVGEDLLPSAPRSAQSGSLEDLVASLVNLDVKGVRLHWRNHLGGTPPAHLPRWLLLRDLAYRIQAAALGGLEKGNVARHSPTEGRAPGHGPFLSFGSFWISLVAYI